MKMFYEKDTNVNLIKDKKKLLTKLEAFCKVKLFYRLLIVNER